VSAGAARGGTILLVEDEEDIATLVRTYLEKDGFRVIWAARGAEGLEAFEQHDIRLAILDLQLPDADGLDLCRAIRRRSRLPIVIVTARDEEIDRITGLELGADDYVTKPFSPRELVARVRAVLRRSDPDADEQLVAGDVVLEREGRTVAVAGIPVELTGMEFELLAFLLAHPGTVMSRERLLERVWGLSFPGGTRTVDVHVAQLRKKLDRPDLIRTVRGAGYKSSNQVDGSTERDARVRGEDAGSPDSSAIEATEDEVARGAARSVDTTLQSDSDSRAST
jgi:DNA-binding response OmpR family regulator